MTKDLEIYNELFGACRTVMLPMSYNSDCYAVYSKEEWEDTDKRLLVGDKCYKHRLYFYKRINTNKKTLSVILLEPSFASHERFDAVTKKCEEIVGDRYGAFEVYCLFTARTTDKIDAILEKPILDVTRVDFGKNDILLAYGGRLDRTSKYKNLSAEELKKINAVRQIKINNLKEFLFNNSKNNIYAVGLNKDKTLKSVLFYDGEDLISLR